MFCEEWIVAVWGTEGKGARRGRRARLGGLKPCPVAPRPAIASSLAGGHVSLRAEISDTPLASRCNASVDWVGVSVRQPPLPDQTPPSPSEQLKRALDL